MRCSTGEISVNRARLACKRILSILLVDSMSLAISVLSHDTCLRRCYFCNLRILVSRISMLFANVTLYILKFVAGEAYLQCNSEAILFHDTNLYNCFNANNLQTQISQ